MYAITMNKNLKLKHHHENYKYDQSHPLYYQQGAASYFVNNRTRQAA